MKTAALPAHIRARLGDLSPVRSRRKYGNQPALGPLGEMYDSRAELAYAFTLETRRIAGTISRWSWSPRFLLQADPLITIRFDFVFWTLDNLARVVDVKGGPLTRDFSVKARMWKAARPGVPLAVVRNNVEEWV